MITKIIDYIKIKPVIVYPSCILSGRKQDCFNCGLYKKGICESPRGQCVRCYPNHKKGCPNYGKYSLCPPIAPMFDEIFDMTKDFYLIYIAFNIGTHIKKMKEKHPTWTDRQLRNLLYWQGTAKKMHQKAINEFLNKYGHLGYEVAVPEALGIDVNKTFESIGLTLEWPPINKSYRIAIAGIPKTGKSLKNLETNKNNSLTKII